MHEFGIIDGVIKTVKQSAEDAGATKVYSIKLRVGDMTEAVEESLQFAYEVLTEGTILEGSTLEVEAVHPRSRCVECGAEFEHDRFHVRCPECNSPATTLIAGKELEIASIDVEIPDPEE